MSRDNWRVIELLSSMIRRLYCPFPELDHGALRSIGGKAGCHKSSLAAFGMSLTDKGKIGAMLFDWTWV